MSHILTFRQFHYPEIITEEISQDSSNVWEDKIYFWWDNDHSMFRIIFLEKGRAEYPNLPNINVEGLSKVEANMLGAELSKIDPNIWEEVLTNSGYDYTTE